MALLSRIIFLEISTSGALGAALFLLVIFLQKATQLFYHCLGRAVTVAASHAPYAWMRGRTQVRRFAADRSKPTPLPKVSPMITANVTTAVSSAAGTVERDTRVPSATSGVLATR